MNFQKIYFLHLVNFDVFGLNFSCWNKGVCSSSRERERDVCIRAAMTGVE